MFYVNERYKLQFEYFVISWLILLPRHGYEEEKISGGTARITINSTMRPFLDRF
jgi:hypothetical protein